MSIENFEPYKILIRSYFPNSIIYDHKDNDQIYCFVAITFDFTIIVYRFNCFIVESNIFTGIRNDIEINTLNDTLKYLNNKYGNQSMTNTDIDAIMQQYMNYVKTRIKPKLDGDYPKFPDVHYTIMNKAKFIRRNELKWKDIKEISKCLKIHKK